MDIRIIDQPISINEVADMAKLQFGEMIKAVVDVNKKTMALGGDLHADAEQLLLEQESAQQNLWGINLYPAKFSTDDFIEFDSMINIRPSQSNRSRSVENEATQALIREIVSKLVGNE